ncbi:MAG: hypothetical protein IKR34_05320 [Candidatus Gastranaerophilales bacterium]|nr:hypothetical protein [Candidatus Gastranaerophilales bacterium]
MLTNEEIVKNFLQKLYDEKIVNKSEVMKLKKKLEIVNIIELSEELKINPDECLMRVCGEINKYLKQYPKIKKSEVTEKNIITLEKYNYNLIASFVKKYFEIFFLLQEIVVISRNLSDGGNTIGARKYYR